MQPTHTVRFFFKYSVSFQLFQVCREHFYKIYQYLLNLTTTIFETSKYKRKNIDKYILHIKIFFSVVYINIICIHDFIELE